MPLRFVFPKFHIYDGMELDGPLNGFLQVDDEWGKCLGVCEGI